MYGVIFKANLRHWYN